MQDQYLKIAQNLIKNNENFITYKQDKENALKCLIIYNFYYYCGIPLISDEIYDKFVQEYEQLYEKLPENMDQTQHFLEKQTREELLTIYEKHRGEIVNRIQIDLQLGDQQLPYPMPSLKKYFLKGKSVQIKEIRNWISKYKIKGKFIASTKLDGSSVMVHVIDSQNIKLYTRGNGQKGRDISHLLKYVNIDLEMIRAVYSLVGTSFGIRGEIIIPMETYEKKYKKLFPNPRLLSTQINKKYINSVQDLEIFNDLDIVFYQYFGPEIQCKNVKELQTYVKEKTNLYMLIADQIVIQDNMNDEELIGILKIFYEGQKKYPSDGIVLQQLIDDIPIQGKTPENRIAVKFQEISEFAVVDKVNWQISKNGRLTPVLDIFYYDGNVQTSLQNRAILSLDGVQVRHVTANNANFITEYQIGRGTVISVVRSGQVIPFITSIVSATQADLPTDMKFEQRGVDIYVIEETKEQRILQVAQVIQQLFEKMDIKKVGEKTIENILSNVIFTDEYMKKREKKEHKFEKNYNYIFKFFEIQLDNLISLHGFGQIKAETVIQGIQEIKEKGTQDPISFISFMSLKQGLAKKTIELILEKISDKKISLLSLINYYKQQTWERMTEKLLNINGISFKKTETIKTFLRRLVSLYEKQPFIKKIIDNSEILLQNSISCPIARKQNPLFFQKHFVLSGTRDKDIQNVIQRNGGYVQDGYTKQTDVVVIIASQISNITSKLQRAISDKKQLFVIIEKDENEMIDQMRNVQNKMIFFYSEFILF